MATWQNAVVTQRGLNLQAKLEAGSTLMITKAVSSTNYVNPATLDRMTEIPNQKQTLIMNDVVPIDGGRAIFGVMLTNINLTESYILNQIGVFARDPDLGEILYFVAQAEEPDTIPSAAALPDFSITYSFNMIIANAGIISAAIDPLALATKDDILALRAKDKQQDDSLSTIDADILALREKDKQHDTELSNKVNYLVPKGEVFDFNLPGKGYGTYRITNAYVQSTVNGPLVTPETSLGTLIYGVGSNGNWEQQLFLNQYGGYQSYGHIYYRTAQDRKGKVWYPWKTIATAEPPQEYNLPLAAGWSGSATYFKTQDNVCTVNVNIKKGEAIGMGSFTVATMPVSFRPLISASCCAINEKVGYITTTASHFAVHKAGEVAIQMNDSTAVGFRASLTYRAVN